MWTILFANTRHRLNILNRMHKINTFAQRKPIGGHHFTDRGQIIKADTYKELVREVADFRLANGYDYGNPEQDVLSYYLSIAPWLVESDIEDKLPQGISERGKQMRDWVNGIWQAGNVVLATPKTANERCEGCKGCKYSEAIDWDENSELMETQKRAALIRNMRKTTQNDRFCLLHKWVNGIAVWLLKPRVLTDAKRNSPMQCFVHKID